MGENNNDLSTQSLSQLNMPRTVSVEDHRSLQPLLVSSTSTLHPPQLIVTPTSSPNSSSDRRSRLTLSHSLHSITDESAMRRAFAHRQPSPSPHSGAHKHFTAPRRCAAENSATYTLSKTISNSKIDSSIRPQINLRINAGLCGSAGAVSQWNGNIGEEALGLNIDSSMKTSQPAMAAECLKSYKDSANAHAADNNFAITSPTTVTATSTANLAAGLEPKPDKQVALQVLSSMRTSPTVTASSSHAIGSGSLEQSHSSRVRLQQQSSATAHNATQRTHSLNGRLHVASISLSQANSSASGDYITSTSATISNSTQLQHTSPQSPNTCHYPLQNPPSKVYQTTTAATAKPVTTSAIKRPVCFGALHSQPHPIKPTAHSQSHHQLPLHSRAGAHNNSPSCLRRQDSQQQNQSNVGAGLGAGANSRPSQLQQSSPQLRSTYHQHCLASPSSAYPYSSFGSDSFGSRFQSRRGCDIPSGRGKGAQHKFWMLRLTNYRDVLYSTCTSTTKVVITDNYFNVSWAVYNKFCPIHVEPTLILLQRLRLNFLNINIHTELRGYP